MAAHGETLTREFLLGVAEMAIMLGISRTTLDLMFQRGDGPPTFFLGKRRKITPVALRQWIQQCQHSAIETRSHKQC